VISHPSRHRRRTARVAGVCMLLIAAGCGGHAAASAPTSAPPVRTDPSSVFVPVQGVTFISAPADVVTALTSDLTSKLPLGSVEGLDARSAIIAADQTARVTAISTTSGYSAYPTFFPLVLQVLGSGEAPVDGVNAFMDGSLRIHEVWQDGQVIVDVASLDQGTSERIAAALRAGTGPGVPPTTAQPPQDPASVLAPLPGLQYQPVPVTEQQTYLDAVQQVQPEVAAALHSYVLAQVASNVAPEDPPIAVVLAASLDPSSVAWLVAGPDGAVVLNAGGSDPNPIKVKLGTPTIGSTPDGHAVIAWLSGSVAVLVTAPDATVAAPVLAGLGAPGY
jgi:hypothetical protein